MSRSGVILFGVLPLMVYGEVLEKVVVEGKVDEKERIKEASFYRTYTKDTITREDIAQQSAIDIKDALSSIPGVMVKDTGSFTKQLSIRGLSGDRVISVVDGMKLSNQGITHSGGGELGLVDLSSVEKIELVKGSPAVIYDPGATGGVINVTTIKDVSSLPDQIGFKYKYGYDDGYMLNTNSLLLEGKYSNFYSSLLYSALDSKGRHVKDQDKLNKVLGESNIEQNLVGSGFEITNLGFESKAYQFFSSYELEDIATFYLKVSDYNAEDISFTHGGQDAMVFQYDEYERENAAFGIKSDPLLGLDYLDFNYNHQLISKMKQVSVYAQNRVEVKSDTFKVDAQKSLGMYELLFGAEYTMDKAKTYTHSEQKYVAAYLNGTYHHDNFTLTAGLRQNYYKAQQNIQPGRNLDTVYELAGSSGVLKEPITESGLSYAVGLTYLLNENNNISANYSKTYRNPSLYERFAFDTFIGGGSAMEPEKADNFEFSYKYLDDTLSVTATLFYTDFETYNDVYSYKQVKNKTLLDECNKDVECDPYDGGENEREIFFTLLKYTSFDNVKNRGFEFSIEKEFVDQHIVSGLNIALNDFTDAEVWLENASEPLVETFDQDPLEFSAFVKKRLEYKYQPWIQLNVKHTTNRPEVKQKDGFDPFTVVNLYFGGEYKNFVLNGGVRNLTDEVYHEPYMGLDGVKRTFFMNVTYTFDHLL
ncbi:MAG: TonB-dependent receptor [Epsilonproteobacteria bacterium]|nr:TonB-dependent receptor [Campylobacterota bacterium]